MTPVIESNHKYKFLIMVLIIIIPFIYPSVIHNGWKRWDNDYVRLMDRQVLL